jgi:hypothetical protein
MAEALDPEALYGEVADLFLNAHTREGAQKLLALVDSQWPQMAARTPGAHDAEVCRLAMLTAAQEQDYSRVRLWRARALARFAAIGWREGIALIIMGEAFIELARENDDYARGRTIDAIKTSGVPLDVVAEIDRFTTGAPSGFALGPGCPSQAVLRRLVFEKRAFLQFVMGDAEAAHASYVQAYDAAGNARGRVKVRLGQLLVEYTTASNEEERQRCAEETEQLAAQAREASSADVAETAEANAEVMRQGRRDLVPYEIL